MLFQLIKKELILFLRRPRELIILLLMPFMLITILGAAFGSINSDEPSKLNIKLAIIQKDQFQEAEEKMIEKFRSLPIPEEEKERAITGIAESNPIKILLENVFGSEEMTDFIETVRLEEVPTEKEALQYSGVLIIPENFTEQYYEYAFFKEGKVPGLSLKLNESSGLKGSILKDFFTSFQKELTFWAVAVESGIDTEAIQERLEAAVGEKSSLSEKKTVSALAYYAIGMSIMFMFYVAGNTAELAYEEKENKIFDRLLLANIPLSLFFSGIFAATALVVFLQLNILYGLSALIFGVKWPGVLDYLVVTVLLSLMVGGVAVLLSSISYRLASPKITHFFSNGFIPIIAFFAGSFVPMSVFGGTMETVSKYSPGGAGFTAYYQLMQGYSLADISGQLVTIVTITIVLFLTAFIVKPKRGEIA